MWKIFKIFLMWLLVFDWQCMDYPINSSPITLSIITRTPGGDISNIPRCQRTARILALDCKGGNAILANELLKSIEGITGQAIGKSFHMLYGMGSGAFPAARLSLYNTIYSNQVYAASRLSKFYNEHRCDFYKLIEEGFCSSIFSCCRIPEFIYDTSVLYNTVTAGFDKLKMSQLSNDVVIPYWNYDEKRLVCVKSYDCRLYGAENYYLKDLVTAAMSTPHFFNPFSLHRVNHGMTNFYTKAISAEYIIPNLGFAALTEAYSLYRNADSYLLVSIGPDDFIKRDYASNKIVPASYNDSPSSFYAQLTHTGSVYNKPVIRCHLRIPSSNFHQHVFQVDDLLTQHLIPVLEDTEVIEKISILSDFLKLPMIRDKELKRESTQLVDNHINKFFEICPPKVHPVWKF